MIIVKLQIPHLLKYYVLKFADLYHQYKVETENLQKIKYSIHSSLSYYKKTGMIQLAYNDKPGDLLPPMSLSIIKSTPDIVAGLHPIDVNSINDLYYLSRDRISKLIINDTKIQVFNENNDYMEYDVNDEFNHENLLSKRVSFLIGYMQAEKLMKKAYEIKDKYKIVRDNITTLEIVDIDTKEVLIKTPFDILFTNEYKNFSKEDISRLGFICGQMAKM